MTKVDTHSREELRVEGADPELDSKIYVMYVQLICGQCITMLTITSKLIPNYKIKRRSYDNPLIHKLPKKCLYHLRLNVECRY